MKTLTLVFFCGVTIACSVGATADRAAAVPDEPCGELDVEGSGGPRQVALLRALELRRTAQSLVGEGRMDEAAAQYAAVVETGVDPAALAFEAGIVHALAGLSDEAIDYLEPAVDDGLRVEVSTVDELRSLRDDPRWSALVERQHDRRERYRTMYSDPTQVRFVTDDLKRFACVFAEAAHLPPDEARAAFAGAYFAMASAGLEWFYLHKTPNDSVFTERVLEHENWYSSVSEVARAIDAQVPAMRGGLQRLQALYPEAVFADVHFVVGGLGSGGSAGSAGVSVGADVFGRVP